MVDTVRLFTVSCCVLLLTKGARMTSDSLDRIEDHHTSSSQVSPIVHDEDSGVAKRGLEDATGGKENQNKGISETFFDTTVERRCVHVGGNVTLFSNTGGQYRLVSMYAMNETYIASWLFKDDYLEKRYLNPNYSAETDRKGNIGFSKAEKNYTGTYYFICDPPCKQLDMELIVLDNLTDEVEKIKKMPHNQEFITKHLDEIKMITQDLDDYQVFIKNYSVNLTLEELQKISKRLDNQEVITKHLVNLTLEELQMISKRLDNQEVITKHLDGQSLEADHKITVIIVLNVILVVIISLTIIVMVMMNKDRIFAWINWKKLQIISHHDSPSPTSYLLMWEETVNGIYQLQKYIIRYREVHIKPEKKMYELGQPISSFISVDNILQSAVSCELSPLIPGKYYQVEIQAIFTQRQSYSQSFIFKTKESFPQPVRVISQHDSPKPTSYLLMWDKPDDGGSHLLNYILSYQEVAIISNKTEYELSWPLSEKISVDNIAPSVLRYELSHLTPGRYYQVEIQAINNHGQSIPQSFIFRTKEGIPQSVSVTSHRDSPDSMSYQLLWKKPDDRGSPLQKYIINYQEVQIKAERTEYELEWPLNPYVTEDNIPPSAVCYTLSDLKPGAYYQVEIQAVNNQGQSSPQSFIFKTKEMQNDSQLPVEVDKTSSSAYGKVSGTNGVQQPRKETSDANAYSPLNSL